MTFPSSDESGESRANVAKPHYRLLSIVVHAHLCSINSNSFIPSSCFLLWQIMKLMNSILGEKLFNMLMKSTFYGHFVAGEDQVKIVPTLER